MQIPTHCLGLTCFQARRHGQVKKKKKEPMKIITIIISQQSISHVGIFLYFTCLQIALKVLLLFGYVEANHLLWLGINFTFFHKLPISSTGCDYKDVGDPTVTSTREADCILK